MWHLYGAMKLFEHFTLKMNSTSNWCHMLMIPPTYDYILPQVLYFTHLVPDRASTDWELLTESWLPRLSSAAGSWQLWLSTTKEPLDSRAAIWSPKNKKSLKLISLQVDKLWVLLLLKLTLFCKLSSCSLYNLSFSSRSFFSSSSFFTKSISL